LRSALLIGENAAMRPRLATIPVAIVAFLVAALVGCGGGDETATAPATTSGEPLTKAELTDQANQLCSGLVQDLEALGPAPSLDPKTMTPDSIRASSDFYDQSADAGEDAVAELSGLTPPQAVANSWDRFLKLYEQVLVTYPRTIADAADSGDRSTFFKAILRGQTTLGEFDSVSGSLGLSDCQFPNAS
jgi:hypothetical protein